MHSNFRYLERELKLRNVSNFEIYSTTTAVQSFTKTANVLFFIQQFFADHCTTGLQNSITFGYSKEGNWFFNQKFPTSPSTGSRHEVNKSNSLQTKHTQERHLCEPARYLGIRRPWCVPSARLLQLGPVEDGETCAWGLPLNLRR